MVGRESGLLRLDVTMSNSIGDLQPHVEAYSGKDATVNTDDWGGYNRVEESGRRHVTVCHTPGKRVWARDLDGDGVREVHVNMIEGTWTGLRNFLRMFRGVSKHYLNQYVSIHEWAVNIKKAGVEFFRAMCGVTRLAG